MICFSCYHFATQLGSTHENWAVRDLITSVGKGRPEVAFRRRQDRSWPNTDLGPAIAYMPNQPLLSTVVDAPKKGDASGEVERVKRSVRDDRLHQVARRQQRRQQRIERGVLRLPPLKSVRPELK